jgi:hypothetical protein
LVTNKHTKKSLDVQLRRKKSLFVRKLSMIEHLDQLTQLKKDLSMVSFAHIHYGKKTLQLKRSELNQQMMKALQDLKLHTNIEADPNPPSPPTSETSRPLILLHLKSEANIHK